MATAALFANAPHDGQVAGGGGGGEDLEEDHEVEAILGEKNGKFCIKWKGFSESEATWERAALCAGCEQLIEDFRQAERVKKLRTVVAGRTATRMTRHGLRAKAELWHSGSGGEFPVHMEDVSSLVCEYIDEARDLCAVALVCRAWLRAARRAAGCRLRLLELPSSVGGMVELEDNRLVSFCGTPSYGPTLFGSEAMPQTRLGHDCQVWDLSSGTVASTIPTAEPVTAIEALPHGRLAIATHQPEIRRYPDSPNGGWVYNSSEIVLPQSCSLRIYSLSSGKVQLDLPLQGEPRIHRLLLLPDSNRLVATSVTSVIYDISTGSAVMQLPSCTRVFDLEPQRLTVLPGGLFAATQTGSIRIFDASGVLQKIIPLRAHACVTSAPIMLPGGNEILFGQRSSSDGTRDCPIAAVDLSTGEEKDSFYGHNSRWYGLSGLACLPGTCLWASCGPADGCIEHCFKIWTAADGGGLVQTLKVGTRSSSLMHLTGLSGGRIASAVKGGIGTLTPAD